MKFLFDIYSINLHTASDIHVFVDCKHLNNIYLFLRNRKLTKLIFSLNYIVLVTLHCTRFLFMTIHRNGIITRNN